MSAISQKAADLMQEYIRKNGFADDQRMLEYAYYLATHYGEAIGALSCEMYEATATAQGVIIKAAEAAPTPEFGEVAKAVHGTMKRSEKQVPSTVGRLVKQVGADTTRQNAARDGAQFAWVPYGDTCAFCITLASRGWQYEDSKNRRPRAEHIHANCDCQYAVRFDSKSTVEGYDPQKYLDMYNNAAPGASPQKKINALRRQMEAEKKKLKIGAPSVDELRKRIEVGKTNPRNKGIVAEKILSGEYNLEYKHQKYLQHSKGTVQYNQATADRGREQSYLTISEEEAQKIASRYAGTGILRDEKFPTVEFTTIDKPIGYVFKKGEWIETDRAQIIHSKKGVHIVPVAPYEEIT